MEFGEFIGGSLKGGKVVEEISDGFGDEREGKKKKKKKKKKKRKIVGEGENSELKM
ncbi:hypothetical protein TSUD_58160 [Trifolium subterraneum]|uniref:Uncharacterized protein n=1 Tax=Trifolium subterraneum TaxID=3900 RepID=A0A2Z6N7G1_TRISU|nr:hypothetical protein TSUD_58160 [Trifolium subterraneum]